MLLLLVSWTAPINAHLPGKNLGNGPAEFQVIADRHVSEAQSPLRCKKWENRGADCGLQTTAWQFLVLPGAPAMLETCDGPLSNIIKSICAKGNTEPFTQCGQLSLLLGYRSGDPNHLKEGGYYGLDTMARLLLGLSNESTVIRESFMAVSRATRICTPAWQAEKQQETKAVRKQHKSVAAWLHDIFKNEKLRSGVRMANGRDPRDFFSCGFGESMSVAFRFAFMSKKATHAAFLMQYPTSKRKLRTANPDTDPNYPGRISLGANRAVHFTPQHSEHRVAKDHRSWELYSACLAPKIGDDLHAYTQFYPHGAKPPADAPICYTWERAFKRKLEPIRNEACDREAVAQVLIFAATEPVSSYRSEAGSDGQDVPLSNPVASTEEEREKNDSDTSRNDDSESEEEREKDDSDTSRNDDSESEEEREKDDSDTSRNDDSESEEEREKDDSDTSRNDDSESEEEREKDDSDTSRNDDSESEEEREKDDSDTSRNDDSESEEEREKDDSDTEEESTEGIFG